MLHNNYMKLEVILCSEFNRNVDYSKHNYEDGDLNTKYEQEFCSDNSKEESFRDDAVSEDLNS